MCVLRMQTPLKWHLRNNQHKKLFSSWKLSGSRQELFRELERRKFWVVNKGGKGKCKLN